MFRKWFACFLTATSAFGTSWMVPDEISTIQAALDTASSGDSILVEPGLYSESLLAPDSLFFVMIGLFDTVKEHDEWPIIDPSLLDSSNRLTCLTLPTESSAVIRNIAFANRWPMYPRAGNAQSGGIFNHSVSLEIRSCRFDSTYRGVYATNNSGSLTVADCEFRHNVAMCIRESPSATTLIMNTEFSGSEATLLSLSGHAMVDNCSFVSDGNDYIHLSGDAVIVQNCSFNPSTAPVYNALRGEQASGCEIGNNAFHDLVLTGSAIWFQGLSGQATRIHDNLFQENHAMSPAWTAGVYVTGATATLEISANRFEGCVGYSANASRAIWVENTPALVTGNAFVGIDSIVPCIRVHDDAHTARCFNQDFAGTGWAVRKTGYSLLDADSCWWGDSTGPYHTLLNPQGLGATVTGNVDFVPWLLAPPDSDSTDTAPEPLAPLPTTTQLAVYPNPLNSTATITLAVTEPGVYDVELFNTLGQRALHVWSGSIIHEKQLSLDARALPSGVYFMRAGARGHDHTVLSKTVLLK